MQVPLRKSVRPQTLHAKSAADVFNNIADCPEHLTDPAAAPVAGPAADICQRHADRRADDHPDAYALYKVVMAHDLTSHAQNAPNLSFSLIIIAEARIKLLKKDPARFGRRLLRPLLAGAGDSMRKL
jgi:hypothetical protein